MKTKIFSILLGAASLFAVGIGTNFKALAADEDPVPCYPAPCDTVPCYPAPCDTVCAPVPCNPAPCDPCGPC